MFYEFSTVVALHTGKQPLTWGPTKGWRKEHMQNQNEKWKKQAVCQDRKYLGTVLKYTRRELNQRVVEHKGSYSAGWGLQTAGTGSLFGSHVHLRKLTVGSMEDGGEKQRPTGGWETSLGGSRSNLGKKNNPPKNDGHVKMSVGLQAGLCSWEAFFSSLLQASLSDWTLANYHWFCRCFSLRSLVFHYFWKSHSYSWPLFLFLCNISLRWSH